MKTNEKVHNNHVCDNLSYLLKAMKRMFIQTLQKLSMDFSYYCLTEKNLSYFLKFLKNMKNIRDLNLDFRYNSILLFDEKTDDDKKLFGNVCRNISGMS